MVLVPVANGGVMIRETARAVDAETSKESKFRIGNVPTDASSNPTPRSGIQFVIGCGRRNRSNGATTSETIMHRVRRPEFGKLFGLSAVRGSVPFS